MTSDPALQPLTDEEEAERQSLTASATGGQLQPVTFARLVALNERQQAAVTAAGERR